jgi:hypothetical protein
MITIVKEKEKESTVLPHERRTQARKIEKDKKINSRRSIKMEEWKRFTKEKMGKKVSWDGEQDRKRLWGRDYLQNWQSTRCPHI